MLCQSQFHSNIIESNLGLNNIVNLSGNLWAPKSIELMTDAAKKSKNGKCAIMDSTIPHKNTREAELYCRAKNIPYELISSSNYYEFLSLLGGFSKFIFMPKTPETLSRVTVEARMMGLSVISNKNIGATQEPWYALKGLDLIKEIKNMRTKIPNTIVESFK